MKPEPLNIEELKKDMYPEDVFPNITNEEWQKIDKIIQKEMGFSLDRISANINRKIWNNMKDWFLIRIKSACEFYLEYKDKPELLVKEHLKYEKEVKNKFYHPNVIDTYSLWSYDKYNEWLFKIAFKEVLKEGE